MNGTRRLPRRGVAPPRNDSGGQQLLQHTKGSVIDGVRRESRKGFPLVTSPALHGGQW